MNFDPHAAVVGTYQAVWPGIQAGDHAKAAPSGGPWIDTNTGFLRFVRAATPAAIWIANTPPAKTAVTTERYLQVISDAAIMGARWIVALDDDLARRLEKREPAALQDLEAHRRPARLVRAAQEWRHVPARRPTRHRAGRRHRRTVLRWRPRHDRRQAHARHPRARRVSFPNRRWPDRRWRSTSSLALYRPLRKTLSRNSPAPAAACLNGPPDWRFPPMGTDKITLGDADVKKLDEIWKELNEMTGRRNLGARLFNVSSMLSNLLRSPDGNRHHPSPGELLRLPGRERDRAGPREVQICRSLALARPSGQEARNLRGGGRRRHRHRHRDASR